MTHKTTNYATPAIAVGFIATLTAGAILWVLTSHTSYNDYAEDSSYSHEVLAQVMGLKFKRTFGHLPTQQVAEKLGEYNVPLEHIHTIQEPRAENPEEQGQKTTYSIDLVYSVRGDLEEPHKALIYSNECHFGPEGLTSQIMRRSFDAPIEDRIASSIATSDPALAELSARHCKELQKQGLIDQPQAAAKSPKGFFFHEVGPAIH